MPAKPKFELHRASDRQWYFVLKAANGKVVATSETYTTRAGAMNGIVAVRDAAEYGNIEDLT